MKKYLLKRILLSVLSLFIVMIIVVTLIYSLIDRKSIFLYDDTWNKLNGNNQITYMYNKYSKYNYLTYESFSAFLNSKYVALHQDDGTDFKKDANYRRTITVLNSNDEQAIAENADFIEFRSLYEKKGYKFEYFKAIKRSGRIDQDALYFAVKEAGALSRVWQYLSNLITVETTKDVKTEKELDRYIRIEWDPLSNMPAVVGSGTTHKYLIYFDNIFPYIHQNWVHLNMGRSFVIFEGADLSNVISQGTGNQAYEDKYWPADVGVEGAEKVNTAFNFHSATYAENNVASIRAHFLDDYSNCSINYGGLTRLGNSFIVGIIASIGAYMLGLPLGLLMAKRKDKLFDKIGNMYIIFIMAVPSLAYIFIFASLGRSLFNLPYKFANAEVRFLGYILPTISLMLPSLGGLMKWMRRYMVDQSNQDYVKFAKSQGLSESEIFSKHIFPNALVYIVHGIPGNILGCLIGAFITESVYNLPGVGKLMTNAITKYDNGIIIGCTFFFTAITVISMILGDLLLAKYDPRIRLS